MLSLKSFFFCVSFIHGKSKVIEIQCCDIVTLHPTIKKEVFTSISIVEMCLISIINYVNISKHIKEIGEFFLSVLHIIRKCYVGSVSYNPFTFSWVSLKEKRRLKKGEIVYLNVCNKSVWLRSLVREETRLYRRISIH